MAAKAIAKMDLCDARQVSALRVYYTSQGKPATFDAKVNWREQVSQKV